MRLRLLQEYRPMRTSSGLWLPVRSRRYGITPGVLHRLLVRVYLLRVGGCVLDPPEVWEAPVSKVARTTYGVVVPAAVRRVVVDRCGFDLEGRVAVYIVEVLDRVGQS